MTYLNIKLVITVVLFRLSSFYCEERTKSFEIYQMIITRLYEYHRCDSIFFVNNALNQESDVTIITKKLQLHFNQSNVDPSVESNLAKILNSVKNIIDSNVPLVVSVGRPIDIKVQLVLSIRVISSSIWLFFLNNRLEINDYFKNFYLLDNHHIYASITNEKENTEIVTEIKRNYNGKPVKKILFAKWNRELKLQLSMNDLGSILKNTLNVGILHSPPISKISHKNEEIEVGGYFGNVFKILREELKFNFIKYHIVKELGIFENGAWHGGFGLIANKTVDIFLAPTVMTLDRSKISSFTIPIMKTKICPFLKMKKLTFNWRNYFKPFSWRIWYVLVGLYIASSVSMIVIKYFQRVIKIRRIRKRKINAVYHTETFLEIYAAMCCQGLELSKSTSMRILHFTIYVTTFLMLAHYSATLLAILTSLEYKPPFKNIQGFLTDGTYDAGTVKGSLYTSFNESKDKVKNVVFKRYFSKQNPPPLNIVEGFRQLCERDKYVFFSLSILASSYSKENCIIVPLENVEESDLAIVIQRDSLIKDIFNEKLLRLFENGLLQKLKKSSIVPFIRATTPWVPIEESEIIWAIYFLVGSMFISVCLLGIELLVHKKVVIRRK